MSYLVELNIAKNVNKSTEVFEKYFPTQALLPDKTTPASEFIATCWDKFDNEARDLRGNLFEITLAMLFLHKGLIPFTMQAQLKLIPNVNYDFLFFTQDDRHPIVISAKTSLRERYKQAELEALAIRNVFQKSESHLVSLDEKEVEKRKQDIKNGNIIYLNSIVHARSQEFDELITRLEEENFQAQTHIQILDEKQVFIGY